MLSKAAAGWSAGPGSSACCPALQRALCSCRFLHVSCLSLSLPFQTSVGLWAGRGGQTALNRKITVVLKEGWKKGWGETECLYMPFISSVIWTSDSIQDEMMRFNVDRIRTVPTWPGNVYSWKFTSLSVSACFSLVWEDIWHIHISNNWNSCCSLQLLFVYNNI